MPNTLGMLATQNSTSIANKIRRIFPSNQFKFLTFYVVKSSCYSCSYAKSTGYNRFLTSNIVITKSIKSSHSRQKLYSHLAIALTQ